MSEASEIDTAPAVPLPGEGADVIVIALIEDNRLVREGITALLNRVPDLRVVAGASGADLSLFHEVKPRVVLLDLGLRNGDSLRMAERVDGNSRSPGSS